MSSIPNPFSLVGRAVRAFFTADVKLKRGQGGLQVVLDDRQPSARKDTPAAAPDDRERRELQRMQASLAALLDEQDGNRRALRHLAFIEHALGRGGLRTFHKVPLDVLARAHAQLEGLVTNWSDAGLAGLRSRMAVALAERRPPPERHSTTAAAVPTAADPRPAATHDAADTDAPLAHPQTLEGEEAAEAEAALLAVYGSAALAGMGLAPLDEAAPAARERSAEAAH